MSFTDLERVLSSPPRSPEYQDGLQRSFRPGPFTSAESSSNISSSYNTSSVPPLAIPHSQGKPNSFDNDYNGNPLLPGASAGKLSPVSLSASPQFRLPNGVHVMTGTSRDSIGLDKHFNALQYRQQQEQRFGGASFPPPVSPTRKSNSPVAQHSRFLENNARIDTPRPTLTASSSAAAVNIAIGKNHSHEGLGLTNASPRSPHTNRVLGGNSHPLQINGPQERRQMLSPPMSPLQFSPGSSSLNGRPIQQQQQQQEQQMTRSTTTDSGVGVNTSNISNLLRDQPAQSHEAHGRLPPASTSTPISDSSSLSPLFPFSATATVVSPPSSNDPAPSEESTTATTSTTVTNVSTPQTKPVAVSIPIQDLDHDYDLMVRHLSQQIFNISSNISVLERLVPCLGQRHKDTIELRTNLRVILSGTQDLVKSAHQLVKALARYHHPPSSSPAASYSSNGLAYGQQQWHQQQQQQQLMQQQSPAILPGLRPLPTKSYSDLTPRQQKVLASRRQTHQRLTKDLALVSRAFQELQRQAIEAERQQITTLRRLSSSTSLKRLSQLHRSRSDLSDWMDESTLSKGVVESETGPLLFKSGNGLGGVNAGYSTFDSSTRRSGYGYAMDVHGFPINPGSGTPWNALQSTPPSYQHPSSPYPPHSTGPLGQYHHGRELSVQEEQLLREILAVDGELVFQEALLQEREEEIRKIEVGMDEVQEMMKEIGVLVHEQRSGVDFIHDNILQVRGRVQAGQQELVKASEYHRRSRERLCYLILLVSIVGAVVMLAFVST